ncbi:MAG: [acyl-carrier-protein] S-malonyltransferase [Verrucomicrobia bacterium]|nr:MAG: [acyl-carrier-protein] S-malonyltransferase [Verrucomicrobiota bacterium]
MKTAILFPGQGAQAVGMGKDLATAFPVAKAVFDRANAVLGYDLAQICFEGPVEKLTQSCHAQPGIFVVSVAALEALKQVKPGVTFAAAAGLSSGEWTALYLAGVVSFEDALKVLEVRGQAMQAACIEQPGTMMSVIGADPTLLAKVAQEAGVGQANFNSPEQTVLSGTKAGIDAAEAALKAAGARKVIRLNVAGAFHSPLMAAAAQKLEAALAGITFHTPQLPVVSNVTGQFHTTPDEIRKLMVQQVTGSVQWVADIQCLQAEGVGAYVECGPGKVLTGLVKRIDKQAALYNISDRSSLEAVAGSLAS